MFETTSEALRQFGIFAIAGFFLGFGYDILRFFRILFKKGRRLVNAEDLLYLPFCAFLLFCCIVEYGSGQLRLYYFFAAGLGAALYLATLGNLTKYTAGAVRRLFLLLAQALKKPILWCYHLIHQIFNKIFGTLCQKISNIAKKMKLYLKKEFTLVYNKNKSKMGNLCKSGGEERHVVKAEVRKKA